MSPRTAGRSGPPPGLAAAEEVGRQFARAGMDARATADGAGVPLIDVPAAQWLSAARHVRDSLGMDFPDWLSAVDQPDADPAGLDIVLHVLNSSAADQAPRRLLLSTRLPEGSLVLPSLTGIWPGLAWHERETFEMFGVSFSGFEDGTEQGLRPLLLPEGFEGTPLRKSFVLAARASKPWPGAKEPGESESRSSPGRRRMQPPGVPDPAWGPRPPADPGDGADG